MNITIKAFLLLTLIGISLNGAIGQELKVQVKTPKTIYAGDEFYVRYSLEKKASEIKLDRSVTDLELNFGPSTSSSSSITVKEGVTTKTILSSFTYTFTAAKSGEYSLPVATIFTDSAEYSSEKMSIHVIDRDTTEEAISSLDEDEGYISYTFSKGDVYRHEPIVLNVKFYATSTIKAIEDFVLPEFDNFLQYRLSTPEKPETVKDTINGVVYNCVSISPIVLIPLKAGMHTFGEIRVTGKVRKPRGSSENLFDDIFNTFPYEPVTIYSDSIEIHVKEYPSNIPADFSHLSGTGLKISVSLSMSKIVQNQPFEMELTISGEGNLKMLSIPEIKVPAGIKILDVECVNNITTSVSGISGSRSFVYTLLPITSGKFEIPPYSLRYLDVKNETYSRKASPAILIDVLKSDSVYPDHQDLMKPTGKMNKKHRTAIMVVVDLSESMLAEDFHPNRKQAALEALANYVEHTDNSFGVIGYSAIPVVLQNISEDKKSILPLLNSIDEKRLGHGTATGFALLMAQDELQKINAKNKKIVLVTDGANNSGAVSDRLAASLFNTLNIDVEIIGIMGSSDSAPITFNTDFGTFESSIPNIENNRRLEDLASLSGGLYSKVSNLDELYDAFNQIDVMTKRESQNKKDDKAFHYSAQEVEYLINIMFQDIQDQQSKLKH